jgi:ankyrin repeat protein
MKSKAALIGIFIAVLTLWSADGSTASAPTPSLPQHPEAGLLDLEGDLPAAMPRNSAAVMNSHVAIYIERLAKSGRAIPEQTATLLAAGKAALDAKNYGRSYRLNVRALGRAHGADQIEAYEVAGSLAPALDRALFASGERITLTLRPQFTLGHALSHRYVAESWLKTPVGPIAGTAQTLTIDDLREYRFDHPVQPLPDGIIAVCYRLTTAAGDTLAELEHAVVVAKDVRVRLEGLKAGAAGASSRTTSDGSPAFLTALDTANYAIRSLEQERTRFDDGSFGRSGSALCKYLIRLNWTAAKIPVARFPQFDARLRYPEDVDLAESLVTALATDPDTVLRRSGDMALASASSRNDELLRYRIFVPDGYNRARKYALIVALHSGGGDGEFFEFENVVAAVPSEPRGNAFMRLARERGYILVCPKGGEAGFFGERGEKDVLDIIERVQRTFSIDAKRVFLTGWSGGSEASWRIALKHPDRFAAAAPVGVTPGIATLLTPQSTERARNLPLLYSVPGTEAEQGRTLCTSAKPLLRRFSYTEYPDAEHASVWLTAQPAIFDFFGAIARAAEVHDAAAAGDLNTVRSLLAADPKLLESTDGDGNTPLISACWGPPANIPQETVARFLIDKGANINARNTSGGSPVYFSLRSFDLTRRLIARGADVNVRAYGGLTPLHQAASTGSLTVAKLLIDHGADLNAHGNWGTILRTIVYRQGNSCVEMVKLLLKSGAALQPFSYGNTELHLAALQGSTDLVRVLVEGGADVNAVNEYGHTPLFYAARHGHRATAEALMTAGAKASAIVEANYGRSPQLTAALGNGEAYLWYLGGNAPGTGYAVKTKDHLLVFDPAAIDDSPEAGLVNGRLNPNELSGQKITVLNTRMLSRYEPSVSELAKRFPGASFVLSYRPTTADPAGGGGIPPYRLAAPNESLTVGDIKVHTIPAIRVPTMSRIFVGGEGLGYLVEVDGLKIFHAGLHASANGSSQMEEYRRQIDFLEPFGPIDIVILPVKGRHLDIAYDPYLYLLDQLSPKAVYLIGDDLATEEHRKCVDALRARKVPVAYPEGGIAIGERFHFIQTLVPSRIQANRAGAD